MEKKQPSIAKVTRPVIKGVYPRKRLFHLLDRYRKFPCIWVSGPAGSGKTTLTSTYIDDKKIPCLWYRLDEVDADIASFFYYMGQAGKKAAPRKRKPLPLLTPEYLLGIPAFTRRYFEDLYSRLKPPFILVFDNYQAVSLESQFHDSMSMGLSVVPKGINVILISRSDPPHVFSRLRANRHIAYLGWEELRLTPEESREIAHLHSKEKIAEGVINKLHENALGWAAGLVLMLESAKRKGVEFRLTGSYNLEGIFDYFAAEILEMTDEEVRNFLLRSAFLPSMTAQIAKKLTGQKKAEHILNDLNRNNYFTEKRAAAEPVYQYHPLFREFLLSCAKSLFEQKEIYRFQNRAAMLLEEFGDVEDAAELFIQSGDWKGLTALIMKHAQSFSTRGRNLVLEKWLKSLPDDIRKNNPWLLYFMGVCRLPYNPLEARGFYEKAFNLFKKDNDAAGIFLAWAGIVDTYLFGWDTFKPLSHWITVLEELLESGISFPSEEIEMRVTFVTLFLLLHREPWHSKVSVSVEKAEAHLQNCPDVNQVLMISNFIGYYYSWTGDRTAFSALIKKLEPLVRSPQITPVTKIVWLNLKAIHGWQTYNLEDCHHLVEEGLKLASETGVHVWESLLCGQGVAGSLSVGDLTSARKYLQKMQSLMKRSIEIANYHHYEGWYAALKGDIDSAVKHVEKCVKIVEETGFTFIHAYTSIDLAGLYVEQGNYQQAEDLLEKAFKVGEKMKSLEIEINYYFIKTLLSLTLGQEKTAITLLQRALPIARKAGIVNLLFSRPKVITRLCAKALEHRIEVEYVKNLIRMRGLVPDSPPIYIEHWPWPVKVFTLGRFSLVKDGEPLSFSGKAQKKPVEMLKAMIAFGGREISEYKLTDALWPEAEGDTAHSSFTTTLQRLRKLLGNENIVKVKEGKVTLDSRYCCVDTWSFERLLGCAENTIGKRQTDEAWSLTEKAMGLYQGAFLEKEDEQSWSLTMRERLRSKFLRHIGKVTVHLCENKRCDNVLTSYQKGLEVDSLAEEFYCGQMKCYHCQGRKAEGLAVYKRCKQTLEQTLGASPAPATEKIYQSLLSA